MQASLKILRAGKVLWETPFVETTADADELFTIEQAINNVGVLRAHITPVLHRAKRFKL